jgi:hypothetical protein
MRPDPRGEAVVVSVSEDGPGMPPEVLGRCMEPYFSTEVRGASTGMGLKESTGALVHGLVTPAAGVRLTPDACLFVIEADARERVLAATARRELPILVVGEPAEPRFVHGTTATPLTRLYGRVAGEQPELDLDEEGRFAGAGRP